jgi:hypothetical protein
MTPDSAGYIQMLNTVYTMAVGEEEIALQGVTSASAVISAFGADVLEREAHARATMT